MLFLKFKSNLLHNPMSQLTMLKKIAYLLLSFLFFWVAKNNGKLLANDLISSSTFTDSQISSSRSAFDSLSFLQDRISANLTTRYLQDSNVFLRRNETDANIFNGKVSLGIKGGGLPDEPGLSYRLFYGGNYYYSLTDAFEYESPADHSFISGIELRGAFTKLSFDAGIEEHGGYSRTEPIANATSSSFGEANYLGYKKKRVAFSLSRKLVSSSLSLGISFDHYDYNTKNLISRKIGQERFASDISWFYDPAFLAKTQIGIGMTAGKEETLQIRRGYQKFVAPSLRIKWMYSSKTAFAGWIGFDERWGNLEDSSQNTPLYGLKGLWTAPTNTEFTIDITKQVYSSVFESDSNVATKKFSVGAKQNFDGGFNMGLRYFYEFSDYEQQLDSSTLGARLEDLQNLRISLGKTLNLGAYNDAEVSIFYDRILNNSENEYYDFERNQYGLQLSFSL